ncbi:MAG: hypothetical protein NC184_02295 [Roseburia sp.]|nr:hypothetical protein [Roseburia sp.]
MDNNQKVIYQGKLTTTDDLKAQQAMLIKKADVIPRDAADYMREVVNIDNFLKDLKNND